MLPVGNMLLTRLTCCVLMLDDIAMLTSDMAGDANLGLSHSQIKKVQGY